MSTIGRVRYSLDFNPHPMRVVRHECAPYLGRIFPSALSSSRKRGAICRWSAACAGMTGLDTKNGGPHREPPLSNSNRRILPRRAPSEGFQVRCRFLAVAAGFQLVRHFLVVVQAGQTGALNRRNMDEHVRAAIVGLDETITLGCVEPFHGAVGHVIFSW